MRRPILWKEFDFGGDKRDSLSTKGKSVYAVRHRDRLAEQRGGFDLDEDII